MRAMIVGAVAVALLGGSYLDGYPAPDAVAFQADRRGEIVPESHTISVGGEQIDITLWRAPTAVNVLVAAPSLNSNINDLTGLAGSIASQDCATVIAFDSSQATRGAPIYETIIQSLSDFGVAADAQFSTFGSSATAADALVAAQRFGGHAVYGLSPSDPPPLDANDATPEVMVYVTEGDSTYRPQFDLWVEAGYDGQVVAGADHGTAFFNEADAVPFLEGLVESVCGSARWADFPNKR